MPKRSSEHLDDILPYKKIKLYGEFIYKPRGFFGESVYIKNMGLKDKCVNPERKSSECFGTSLLK
tara:strand:- start:171 stop:365 length:195 start_codon:yes stop_codon:yes gene_type:complete